MENLTIRRAQREDVLEAVELIMESGERALTYVLGNGDRHRAIEFLQSAYVRDDNLFSYQFLHLAVLDEEIVGCVALYDKEMSDDYGTGSALHILRYYGFPGGLFTMWRAGKLERSLPPPKPDVLYVASVAVAIRWRGKGVAKAMMAYARHQAMKEDYPYCALDVEKHNEPALTLYKSLGYEVQYSRPSQHKKLDGYIYLRQELPHLLDDDKDED